MIKTSIRLAIIVGLGFALFAMSASQLVGLPRTGEAAVLFLADWVGTLQSLGSQIGRSIEDLLSAAGSSAWPLPPLWLICLLAGLGTLIGAVRSARQHRAQRKTQLETAGRSELGLALQKCRNAVLGIVAFSGILNVLMLTGSLYMLEAYDRVIPSRSVPTLIGFSVITGALFIGQGLLDIIRSRLLVRIGLSLDEALSGRVFDMIGRRALKQGASSEGSQPVRDLETIGSFLSGLWPTALLD